LLVSSPTRAFYDPKKQRCRQRMRPIYYYQLSFIPVKTAIEFSWAPPLYLQWWQCQFANT